MRNGLYRYKIFCLEWALKCTCLLALTDYFWDELYITNTFTICVSRNSKLLYLCDTCLDAFKNTFPWSFFFFNFHLLFADIEDELMDQGNSVCSCTGKLLLLLIWTSCYLAQTTNSTNSKPTSGWTFSKNQSYVAFSPNLTLEQDQQIKFSFRTRSPNGLLFCHLVEQFNQSFHPLLRNYHFCAELSHGYLQVTYNLNQIFDVIKLGRGKHCMN